MHEVNPEGVFAELDRVKRERDAAKAELEIAWGDCHDGQCRACVRCFDAMEVRATTAERERDEARRSHARAIVALKALVEYAEWLEKELGRMPSLSTLAARTLLPEKQKTEGK